MKDSVIIVSGGLDSITLLYDKAEEIALAISFDYGANHNAREIPFARLHCERLGIKHITIPLAFMHDYFKSSLLSGAGDIPEGHYADDNMRSTVVPFRNGIMLSIAAGIAESHELKKVLIANHGGDHAIYPDCRPGFIRAISDATQAGTYGRRGGCGALHPTDEDGDREAGRTTGHRLRRNMELLQGRERALWQVWHVRRAP